MADYNAASGKVTKGHKSREMRTLLKKVIDFYISYCSEKDLDDTIKHTQKFESLLFRKFRILNKQSRECLLEQSKQKVPKKLPKVSDINQLCK